MSGQSKTSTPTISRDLFSATSSQKLASGALLCVWPDGRITERYGREVALASLSPRQAKALGLMTSGTYGPPSTGLSLTASRALSLSLANRLRARTDLLGSILYRLTWKDRVTPSGRSIPALRASPRRISASASTGSPPKASPSPSGRATPSARDWKDGGNPDVAVPINSLLGRQVWLAGWSTPCQQDGPNGGPNQGRDRLPGCVPLAGWPTPTAKGKAGGEYRDPEKAIARAAGPHANDLRDFVQMAGWSAAIPLAEWASPQAGSPGTENYNPGGNTDSSRKTTAIAATVEYRFTPSTIGAMPSGCSVVIPTVRASGPLNPAHSLWLMLGPYATDWLRCAERVTLSTSRKRKAS